MMNMKYDEIHIEGLQIYANHGVFPEERVLGQRFTVSVTLYTDTRRAGKSDDLAQSTHYGEVSDFLTEFLQNHTYQLIEGVAEAAAEAILKKYPLVKGISLEIKKPWAPIGLPLDYVSIKIERFWHKAYIALGSNMGNKEGYLDFAIQKLSSLDNCRVGKVSRYMITAPYGGVPQDDFLNGCVCLETLMEPEELLQSLHCIEAESGRVRDVHWGPRTLDLDILLYDDLIYESEDLIIPHVEMHLRDFVLAPLAEIAPNKRHPVLQKTVEELHREVRESQNR